MTEIEGIELAESCLGYLLTELQKEIFIGSWQRKTYKQIALDLGYSEKHLKDVGQELWVILSDAIGERISKSKLQTSIEKLSQQSGQTSQLQFADWGNAPDVPFFVGRTQELETLRSWILEDRCRIISILGMKGSGKTKLSLRLGKGGIGKTDFSVKLAKGLQTYFDIVIWKSLLNSPSFKDFISDLLKCLSLQIDEEPPPYLKDPIDRLLFYFSSKRCLLLLDNFESLLRAQTRHSQYKKENEEYATLLQKTGEVPHQSCVLVTSREKPKEISMLESKVGPVRSFSLSGVNDLSCRKIFMRIGKFQAVNEEWKFINHFYNGNPLALELAAKHILEVFNGNITAFLNNQRQLFDDLNDLLNWHLERLCSLELELVYWMALSREPISVDQFQKDVVLPLSKRSVPSTLQSLQRRLPIETFGGKFSLQPVLIEYITEKFIRTAASEIKAGKFNYLMKFAILKALANDDIRNTQNRLIAQPIIQEIIIWSGGTKNFKSHLVKILENLQKSDFKDLKKTDYVNFGYLAGNIVNLLIQAKINLENFDLSSLIINQGFFQNSSLINVDFSNSDLCNSNFIQYFGDIFCGSYSPDGKYIAISDSNGRISLIEIDSNQHILSYQANNTGLWETAVKFSPDGKSLLSGGFDNHVKLWDAKTGKLLHRFTGHEGCIWCVSFADSSEIIASAGDDNNILLWNTSSKKSISKLIGHRNSVRSIAFSPNGQLLASGSHDNTAKIWDVSTGECLQTLAHPHWVLSVFFSLDGKYLICAAQMKVWFWDIQTGQMVQTLKGHSHFLLACDQTTDGKMIASSSLDCEIKIWDTKSKSCLKSLTGHSDWVFSIAFSPNADTLISCGYDNSLKIWNIKTGDCLSTIRGYCNWVYSVDHHPISNIIASAHQDGGIRIWDTNTGKVINLFQGNKSIHAVSFSQQGDRLVSGSHDGLIQIWDIPTSQCISTTHVDPASGGIWSVQFSSDGQFIVSGSQDGIVRVWDSGGDQLLTSFSGHENWIWSVAFSPDGRQIISTCNDQTAKIWDVKTGQCIKTFDTPVDQFMDAAFSPAGNLLAIAGQSAGIILWHIELQQVVATLKNHSGQILAIAFSRDGKMLASGGIDQKILLWDIDLVTVVQCLEGHTGTIRSLAFSSDGQTLLSGSQDGTLKTWDLANARLDRTIRPPRPYENMNITGVQGLHPVQKDMLKLLGAVDRK